MMEKMMEKMIPTTQPIDNVDELLNNAIKQIEYKIEDTELQNSELQWKGKKYKIVERVLKSTKEIVKIESRTEIIEKTKEELSNEVEQLVGIVDSYVNKLKEMDTEIKIIKTKGN